jgi:hypothetical protein
MCFRGFTIARRYPARNPEEPSACSKLTDDELTHIFQAAAPIAIERRDDFLEAVAAILLGSAGPIGPGTVHRAIALRLYFRSAAQSARSEPRPLGPRRAEFREGQQAGRRLTVFYPTQQPTARRDVWSVLAADG